MKKHFVLAPLALAVAAVFSFVAIAEDAKPSAPAAPAAKPAAPAAPAAAAPGAPAVKPVAKPREEVKATITGKAQAKKFKNKKGEEVDGVAVTVATAKAADGKDLSGLTGKTIGIGTKNKQLDLKSFIGKDVTIEGTVINGKHVRVDSIK